MTTSSTVSAPSSRPPSNEPLLVRSATEQRLDALRRRSAPKITGRKLRMPRKFVVTDVPDDDVPLTSSTSLSALSDAGEDNNNNNNNECNNCSDDLAASSSSVRKGKTQVKGRFTITDLSPESPEREDLSASMGTTPLRALEVPRRQSTRRMSTRRPFQSAGDARASAGLTKSRLCQQQQQLQQQESTAFASFQRPAASSPSSRSMRAASPARSVSNQVSHTSSQTQTMFDNHLEFLEKETHEMKNVLEKMVATNAQWIETLTSAGLVHAPRLSDMSISEPVAPVESPLEKKYRDVEKAYTDLQTKYEEVCQQKERMEVKNAMLEIRLQLQINRSTMLRSQLDKLTQYTENLIGESSEPTLHDYNSDLNSLFGEQSEAHSPTAEEMTSSGEYGFSYDVIKSRRQRWRVEDEECMSDTSTEGASVRKTSSPVPFERDDDNNRYISDVELTAADLASGNNRGSSSALDSLLDDQVNQLRQSLRPKNRMDIDDRVSAIDSLDSLAVCASVTNFGNVDDEYEGNNQIGHSIPMSSGLKIELLKHSNSVASLNYSTVSSSSSLAGYGLHLATMAQSKSGYYASVAATSLFGPHPEPYPNASNQQNNVHDDDTVYNVLSPENLRFHDCQSLLQAAAEERSAQKATVQRGFPFTTNKKAASFPGANEVPQRAQSTGSLLQRFSVRRR